MRVLQGNRLGADPGLRHQLLQRLHRQVLARRHREDPDPGRDRQRIPLPRHRCPTRRRWWSPSRQSGETADTLAALRHAQRAGHEAHADHLQRGHQAMVRECKLAYITRAGVEIGVASTKAFTTQLAGLFLLTLALAQVKGRLTEDAGSRAPEGHAPPAGRAAGGAGAGAADHQLGRGLRAQGERAVPGPRAALPDRAGRRAQAQGDHLHPRRGLRGRRAQARPAGAGDQRDAGGDRGAQRRAAGKAQEQHAGSARARRRALCAGRRRHAHRKRAKAST